MKGKACECNLAQEGEEDELHYEITAAHKDAVCLNCWFERTYGQQIR
jgi:hypothetical protein